LAEGCFRLASSHPVTKQTVGLVFGSILAVVAAVVNLAVDSASFILRSPIIIGTYCYQTIEKKNKPVFVSSEELERIKKEALRKSPRLDSKTVAAAPVPPPVVSINKQAQPENNAVKAEFSRSSTLQMDSRLGRRSTAALTVRLGSDEGAANEILSSPSSVVLERDETKVDKRLTTKKSLRQVTLPNLVVDSAGGNTPTNRTPNYAGLRLLAPVHRQRADATHSSTIFNFAPNL
jgi:hypothetical protein